MSTSLSVYQCVEEIVCLSLCSSWICARMFIYLSIHIHVCVYVRACVCVSPPASSLSMHYFIFLWPSALHFVPYKCRVCSAHPLSLLTHAPHPFPLPSHIPGPITFFWSARRGDYRACPTQLRCVGHDCAVSLACTTDRRHSQRFTMGCVWRQRWQGQSTMTREEVQCSAV